VRGTGQYPEARRRFRELGRNLSFGITTEGIRDRDVRVDCGAA